MLPTRSPISVEFVDGALNPWEFWTVWILPTVSATASVVVAFVAVVLTVRLATRDRRERDLTRRAEFAAAVGRFADSVVADKPTTESELTAAIDRHAEFLAFAASLSTPDAALVERWVIEQAREFPLADVDSSAAVSRYREGTAKHLHEWVRTGRFGGRGGKSTRPR